MAIAAFQNQGASHVLGVNLTQFCEEILAGCESDLPTRPISEKVTSHSASDDVIDPSPGPSQGLPHRKSIVGCRVPKGEKPH